jgi:hypothetical protein
MPLIRYSDKFAYFRCIWKTNRNILGAHKANLKSIQYGIDIFYIRINNQY